MRNRLFVSGVILSVLYLGTLLWFLGDKIPGLAGKDLNEVGDFLAGAFSPLAFLWLVLGFLQQGRELKQGTDALLLQASELRCSVEQQKRMAESAAEQLAAQRNSPMAESQRHEEQFQARIIFKPKHVTRVSGLVTRYFSMINLGNDAIHLTMATGSAITGSAPYTLAMLKRADEHEFPIEFSQSDSDVHVELFLSYETIHGKVLLETYDLHVLGEETSIVRKAAS